ncbi:MAG: capsule assembly Wzi family protein [Terriglobales bacterium]
MKQSLRVPAQTLLVYLLCVQVTFAGQAANTANRPSKPAAGVEQCTDLEGHVEPCPLPAAASVPTKPERAETASIRSLPKNIVYDQVGFWTTPARLRAKDLNWLIPFATATTIGIAADTSIERHLPTSTSMIRSSSSFSDYGTAAFAGAAGGALLWGRVTHNAQLAEAGLLSSQALANSFLVTTAIKHAAGRERPTEGNYKGSFGKGSASFPSQHATAAWSVASVLAHEYPGPLTKLLAYGGAAGVSLGRVIGRKHFTSDVLIGSALGWYIGRQVFRAHRADPEIDAKWDTSGKVGEPGMQHRNIGSPYVPIESWIYTAFDRLAALGYVQTAFVGLRPWTRTECARLLQEAGGLLDGDDSALAARGIYQSLRREFADELELQDGRRNLGAQIETVYTRFTGISGQPLTDGYHFSQTLINDYGRPYQEGFNNVTGLSGRATAGPLVFYIRGEYQHASSAPALPAAARQAIALADQLSVPPDLPTAAIDKFELLDAYVGVALDDWQLTFGRQTLWWGPGQGGPMLLSNNAEPIDMVRLNRVTPLKLPSVLGRLGPMRAEFFLGQLAGSEFIFNPSGSTGQWSQSLNPQPFIHGQKISFKPSPNFEFGVFRTTIYGGPGYPFTLRTLARSLFSTINEQAGSATKPGDRRSGVDFSYRVPKLRNWLTIYGDGFTDDQFSPIGYFDRSAWRAGIYLARFPGIEKLDFRGEGVYTDNPIGGAVGRGFYYFNWTWRTGYRNDGNLIGSWIGRDGQGAQAWATYHFTPRDYVQLGFRHQKVSQQFIFGGGTAASFSLRTDLWCRPTVNLSGLLQYERWRFPVLAARTHSNVTSSLQLTWLPGHLKHR